MADKLSGIVAKVVGYFTFILLAVLLCIVFLQVILRYCFNSGLPWSEEMARYLFEWVSFLGVSIGFRKHSHMAVEGLQDLLPKLKKYLEAFYYGSIICFLIYLFYFGVIYAHSNAPMKSTLLPISMADVYSIVPIASALSLFFIICELITKWNNRKVKGGVA